MSKGFKSHTVSITKKCQNLSYLWVEMTGKPRIEQQIPEPFTICVLLNMRSSRAVVLESYVHTTIIYEVYPTIRI